ncbi:MAG: archaetidylserine decarboxylase [Heliobacteriaceae bacterium]|nr:archaetidylserine decarboxylase [Heliobacteriaceae bacterium]MDD4587522.1 archaetidylserine decarboxylase [Heliobacteriaceae bacterium]
MRRIILSLLHILPQKWLSRQAGRFSRANWSRPVIPWFIRYYGIAVEEAEKPWREYTSLAAFFTRRLRPDARPVCPEPGVVVSPVDARVSQVGVIQEGRLVQAKGINYSVEALLGDRAKARAFLGGEYVTLYLSPRDYHWIHAPVSGRITGCAHWPGCLFPVNDPAVTGIRGLFTRNERVVTYIASSIGTVAVVKVGALMVGSVQLVYSDIGSLVAKGDDLGYFQFGSTVILLFEPRQIVWEKGLTPGVRVKTGEMIAYRRK